MSAADSHGHGHAEGPHRPISFYVVIAVALALITFVELGPLFEWYHLPPLALLALSAVKFFAVVAFFMHLWDDAKIFTRLFAAPLLGAISMVVVLMLLHNTFAPSPDVDPLPVIERYRENWNGPCSSWLRSHEGNRWYCASPPLDNARLALHLEKPGGSTGSQGPSVDLAAMSETERHEWLMKRGQEIYETNCQACHQANGQGVPPAFPPLAGADYIQDVNVHAKSVIHGVSGPITVNGVQYNGNMPAQGAMYSDEEIAAILTYERNSWGNNLGDVDLAVVKAARAAK